MESLEKMLKVGPQYRAAVLTFGTPNVSSKDIGGQKEFCLTDDASVSAASRPLHFKVARLLTHRTLIPFHRKRQGSLSTCRKVERNPTEYA